MSNTKDLEEAYASAMNAEGSALAENEKYLDSISGKIDQFTNAFQTMWNNLIGSELIKDVVDLGTGLIQLVDKVGLLNSALLALGTYKGFGVMSNVFMESGLTITDLLKRLWAYISGVKATAAAEQSLTQVQLQEKLVRQGLTSANAEAIIAATGLGVSTDKLTKETLEAAMATLGYSKAQIDATSAKIFGTGVTEKSASALLAETIQRKLQSSTLVQYAINMGLATAADVAKMTTTQLLSLSFKALTATVWSATKAVAAFLFTNPVGWVILLLGAIAGGIAIFNHFHKTTEELKEELSELKSELQDVRSELDSVNQELETTQSRMAELLALDKLTFAEEEELENLKRINDELQREKDLLELKEKQKAKAVADKFVETMESDVNDDGEYYVDGANPTTLDMISGSGYVSESKYLDNEIKNYQRYMKELEEKEREIIAAGGEDTKSGKRLAKQKKQIEEDIEEIEAYINDKTTEWNENAEGLTYGISDEADAWLDYIKEVEDRWAIVSGGDNAKANAIIRVFNKEEFAGASEAIDGLVEKLKQNPGDSAIINQIRSECKLAEEDLKAVGLSVEDAVDSFTKFGSSSSFDTLDKKIDEISKASKTFEQLLNNTTFEVDGSRIELQNLFDKEGKVIQTKLSQIFSDTDEQTRKDITAILEGSYDEFKNGTANIEELLTKFAFKSGQQIIDIQKGLLAETNKKLFPNLDDELSGIIDTFDELASAVGSVVDAMDLLDQARAEEAYSGSISLETLMNLMQHTEDYSKIVSIDETGAIHLAANAQEILIQEKLNAIKANAQLAYEEANKAYQEALAAETSVTAAGAIKNAMLPVIDQVSGGLAYLGSLWSSVSDAWSDGFGGKTFDLGSALSNAQSAYSGTISNRQSSRESTYETSLESATKALQAAEDRLEFANSLTADNVKTKYSSDEASGGTKNAKDAEDKKSQEALDNLIKKYERQTKNLESQQEYLQNKIDTLEAQKEYDPQNAKGISTDYYEEQIRLENEKLKLYRAEYAELSKLEKTDEVAERMWELEHAIQESAQRTLEFRQSIAELYNTAFEDIQNAGDNKDDYLQDQKDYIEAYIEAQGRDTTKADLEQLRTITEQQRKDREETLEDLKATLKQGVDSGAIKEGSDIWIQMNDEIRATELAIQDDTKAINEYSEAIKNIPVEVFDRMREAFGFKDQVYNNQIDYIEGWMELAEKQGYDVPNEALDKILAIYGNAKENNLADIYNAMEDLPKIEAEFGVNSEEYQNAYLKLSDLIKQGLDIDNAIADTQQRKKEQPINEFEDTKDWFAFEDSLIEKRKESIENYISKLEESGDYDGLETKYGELIQAEQDDIDMNMQELTATEAAIKAAIDAGYTMEDKELQNLILHYGDVESEIAASRDRQTELNKEIDSIPVKKLEELKNGYAFINDVLGSYRDVTKGWIDLFKNAGSAIPDELYNELFEINELMQGHNANNLADSLAAFEDIKAKYAPNTKEYQDAVNHIASLYMEEVNLATEAQSYNQEMAEANEEAGNIPVENFERMRDAFAFIADVLASTQGYIESYISLFEELGVDVPTELYDKLIDLEKQKKSNAESDLASALTGFEEIKAAGYTAADEEYRSAEQAILDLKQSILDSDIAMVKWGKTIRDLEFEKFERGVSRANDAIDEVQKIYDLTSKDDVADKDGSWTEDGITSLGLMYEQMELAQQIATKYADEIKELDEAYANGEMSEKEYYERLQQLKDGQWGAIDSYEAAREAIVDMEEARIDMVEEGINKEIEAYRELIETKKEELDAERDLHGFRNKIKDQTKDITSLTRKIAALSGSDNAADIAERRKLQAQLAEAQEQLDETYYDHSKDQQGKALDDELESFQDIKENYVETLRESLDDTAAIISAKINELLVNADTVQQGVNNTAAEYGITLTDLLTNPWNSGSSSADDFAAQVGLDLASLLGESGAITLFENQATTAMQGAFGAARQSSTDFSGGVSIDVNSLMAEPDGPLYKLKQFLTENVSNAFGAAGDASDQTKNDIGADADESETSVTDFETLLNKVLGRIAEKLGTDKETVLSDLKYPWENAGAVLDMLFGDKITGENGLLKKILTETQTWADNMKNGLGSAFDIPKSTLNTFSEAVGKVLDELQVKAGNLAKALSDAANTETPSHTGNGSGGSNDYQNKIDNSPGNTKNTYNAAVYDLQRVLNSVFGASLYPDGLWGSKTESALKAAQKTMGMSATGNYNKSVYYKMREYIDDLIGYAIRDEQNTTALKEAKNRVPWPNAQFSSYAKGTLGTKKDGWAFTDESWIGEEITLAAGKNGQIQYLKKGSSVMPSDISTNLIEWGKLNPEMMNLNGGVNFNMINNATTKPEFNLSFEALVKADKITEDTLPEVKKYVSQEINNLVKQMNYAIKGYSR